MSWIFDGAAAVVVLVGVWVLLPTLRTFLRRDFGPTWRNHQSVFYAEQSSHP